MTPKKLSAERLAEIRLWVGDDSDKWCPLVDCQVCTEKRFRRDLLAHCDALAAENQVLREALKLYAHKLNYAPDGMHSQTAIMFDAGEVARTALEKTS